MTDYARTPHDFTTGETPSSAVFDGLPGGIVGAVTASTATGSIGATEVTVLSRTVTVNAAKAHLLIFQCNLESTVADDKFRIRIKDGSTELVFREHRCRTANSYETVTVIGLADSLSAGAHTLTVTIERVAGSGSGNETSAAASPKLLVCIELGPNT